MPSESVDESQESLSFENKSVNNRHNSTNRPQVQQIL
jgi:hypothetical protein